MWSGGGVRTTNWEQSLQWRLCKPHLTCQPTSYFNEDVCPLFGGPWQVGRATEHPATRFSRTGWLWDLAWERLLVRQSDLFEGLSVLRLLLTFPSVSLMTSLTRASVARAKRVGWCRSKENEAPGYRVSHSVRSAESWVGDHWGIVLFGWRYRGQYWRLTDYRYGLRY